MHKITSFLTFTIIITLVQGVPLQDTPNKTLKSFERCLKDGGVTGMFNCAASRSLKILETLENQQNLQLLPGVTLINNNDINSREAKQLHPPPLPMNPTEKALELCERLLNTTTRLIAGKSIKVTLPEIRSENIGRAFEEGRGKMKKMVGPLMLGLGAKMLTVVPIMMGGLALLTTKALVIGKIAFVISIILVIQYFFSGRVPYIPYSPYGGGYSSYGTNYGAYGTNTLGWGTSQTPYGPYARSIDFNDVVQENSTTDQQIAYSSHN